MLKEIFHDSLKFRNIVRICMENNSRVTGWQELFSHTNPSKFRRPLQSLLLRLPNFNMRFQLVLTKLVKRELFLCLQKVDHVIN